MPCKKHANQAKPCETSYSPRPYLHVWPRMRGRAKKTGPVKKEWQVGRDNDSRSRRPRTAAPGLARGADGAVVLNLRRGPGAYALLSRADGQLTRAGQRYYSHLGLRARTLTTTSPSSDRAPATTSCCAACRRSSCESTG